jgi:hypothetical protein
MSEEQSTTTATAAGAAVEPPAALPPPMRPPVVAEVDVSRLELADILLLDDITAGRPYPIVDAARMLDRVLVGGVKGRSISQFGPLLGRLLAIVQEIANPKSGG